jgi:hypothetical protein
MEILENKIFIKIGSSIFSALTNENLVPVFGFNFFALNYIKFIVLFFNNLHLITLLPPIFITIIRYEPEIFFPAGKYCLSRFAILFSINLDTKFLAYR